MICNKIIRPSAGADLSRTPPIMEIYKITQTPAGADLSCTPPIYRPWWMFRYPDLLRNVHNY
jgi:hypothetical protein